MAVPIEAKFHGECHRNGNSKIDERANFQREIFPRFSATRNRKPTLPPRDDIRCLRPFGPAPFTY